MASDGKIIIDTKLDTSGLEKDVDTASKKVVGSMSNVEKSVKKASAAFDGSKMANQLNNVTKSIENTNQKLDLETQKLAKLKEAYSSAMDPAQQNKLQKDIVNTESEITRLEGKLNGLKDKQINLTTKVNTESIDKAVTSINKAGSSISSVGNSLSTKVTLPIVAAAAASGKFAADFEHQMADISKEVKAKGEDVNTVMSQMSANSIKWSEYYGQSTDDINKGLLILVKDGYSGAESMDIMGTALKTARGANEDLFTTIDKLGGSLEAYGQKTDNAATTTANMAHMADTFAYISNHTKASIDSLGEAFSTVGQTASALGQPMEQTAAAIGILQSSNIDASTAATSLKAGLVNLTKPTKQMQKGMKELGITAFDSNGKMKDYATIIDDVQKGSKNLTTQQKEAAIAMVFGKESLASWTTLINKGGDYLRTLSTDAGNATGEVQELSDSMKDTSVNKMKEFEASAKALGITFGKDVLPTITPIVNDLTGMLKSFSDLDEETKKQIIDFALMAAAAGPVLKVIGGLTSGIGSLVKFGGNVATTFGLLGEGAEIGGTALAGFSTAAVAATGVSVALVAGVAGVITYNELMNKSVATSTDDLNGWEKAVNAVTGGTIKSKEELQKAGLAYKDFGDGVSKKFQDGIIKADEAYKDFQSHLTVANLGDKISDSDNTALTDSINKMIDGAKSAISNRKGEIQNQLTDLFTADGSGIDEGEQKVLDEAGKGFDAKLDKVNKIQKDITEVWQKAIAEHGKLSENDVTLIKNYLQEIQQIKAEAEAENNAESSYAKNEFSERLTGMSDTDAAKEYQDATKTLTDNFIKEKATYKTGIDRLTQLEKEANAKGNTEVAEDYKKQIEEKTKKYEDVTGKEYAERRAYLTELYKQNPNLEGQLNEVTGELFTDKDKYVQGNLSKMKDEFAQIKEVTKSGMIEVNKPVQDANGQWRDQWHDIEVTVDSATGQITSSYDTLTGEVGGYSQKFQDDAKKTGDAVRKQMADIQKAIESPTGLKIDSNNGALDGTGKLIGQFDTVIDKADKTKVAIANINGAKVKLEFDKEGALKNTDDIKAAIDGKIENNPAVVNIDVNDKEAVARFKDLEDLKDRFKEDTKTTVTIDGKGSNSITEAIDKLEKLPKDTKSKIEIDGQEVATVDEAIKKLKEVPKETSTKITVNGEEVTTADEALKKFNEIKESDPNATIEINGEQISTAEEAKAKLDEITNSNPHTTVQVNAGDANAKLQSILNKVNSLDGKDVTITTKIIGAAAEVALGAQNQYTGSNTSRVGFSYVNEHGYETANNTNVETIGDGLAFIREHHYTGGDGINDHMTTVNEMHNDITNQVGSTIGQTIAKLQNGFSNEQTIMKDIAKNTKDTVANGDKANQLSKENAEKMVNGWNSKGGTFANLQAEITFANSNKEAADKMKVEDDYSYKTKKAQMDDLDKQLDDIKDKMDSTDSEGWKKELEKQQKAIEIKKRDLEDETNKAKDEAEKRIQYAKDEAEKEVKAATEKKEKLTKLAEAVTTAIKNQLEQQKAAADKKLNDQLTKMETDYNNKTQKLEDETKRKTDKIDQEIKDLEKESTDTSRQDERTEANNNISALQTKIANTADEADKRKFQLELEKAQKELNKKEDSWDIEDQKQSLEDEKTKITDKEEKQKKTLEKQYNASKKAKEDELKATDAYYDKLLETDSINAQARYTLLNSNSQQLVNLLDSYAPGWQNAGKNLADSLLDGLDSQKQTVQQAVDDMISLRGSTSSKDYYYNGKGEKVSYATGKVISGYSSGTSSNPVADYYLTNEDGPEMRTSGDVAYVSKGAAIKNAMQTDKFISSEIASQVALMKSAVIQSQMDMARNLSGLIQKSTTTNNKTEIYQPQLIIQEYHQHTNMDAEQLANEFDVMAYKQKTS